MHTQTYSYYCYCVLCRCFQPFECVVEINMQAKNILKKTALTNNSYSYRKLVNTENVVRL